METTIVYGAYSKGPWKEAAVENTLPEQEILAKRRTYSPP